MSNLVPEGWSVEALDSVTKVIDSAHQTPVFSSSGYPMVRVGDIKGGRINLAGTASVSTEVFDVFTKKYQPQYNDILMTRVGSYGRSSIVKTDKAFCLGQNTVVVNPKSIDADYLYQFLQGQNAKDQIEDTVGGSSQKSLSLDAIKNLKVPISPLSEQKKIASILTSVDDVIEKTQAQIDKLKDLKTGMMQELLTSGVGVDGKPHTEFKDSPVGKIPKGWDCCLLDKVAKRGSGHTPDKKKPEYWNDGVKWVSLTDSSKLDKLYISDTAKKISQLGIENSSATLHPKGTVVMARDAGVGKSAIMTSSMAVSQHFMAWVCGEKLDNYFLYYLLQHWKPQFEAIAMGSTIKTIGLPYFKKLQIPVPSIEEQRVISGALKSVDNKMFALERKHKQLTNTKKALMQDLLTGKVRVKVDS
ncbi:restriction endonuclease subunit S [Vibrio alginolyticus]|uniref:restriction endonuclease subunit S n=1 Tax=Vibrio TaxID=662 RepID=UPI00215C3A27|nr:MULTISPECIES: restriction endonuclease subunit S [Vibrio]MCR9639330.1 restriction endonuclease subunit S [Vibrio alginolyticus]MDW2171735.1 restriction endonuclease subunit S [Vibrio sp. 1567]